MINGFFEMVGGVFLLLNIIALYKHKELKGVHWGPTVFFTTWGIWNLYYYPSLNQWYSFAGGIVIATINSIWLLMICYYKYKEKINV